MTPQKRFFWYSIFLILITGSLFYILYTFTNQLSKSLEMNRRKDSSLERRLKRDHGARNVTGTITGRQSIVSSYYLEQLRSRFPRNNNRVVVIGLDGVSNELISSLLSDNRLPFFQWMIRTGSYGNIRSIPPIISPATWTSIATGKSRYKHGIREYVKETSGGNGPLPVSSLDRKTKAVWNMANDFDRTTVIINWLVTTPPEQVRGCMVSDAFEFAIDQPADSNSVNRVLYPANLTGTFAGINNEIETAVQEQYDKMLRDIRFNAGGSDPGNHVKALNVLKESIRSDILVYRASLTLLKKIPFDAAFIFFQGPDMVSHHFWGQGKHPDAGLQAIPGGPLIAAYYVFTGDLMDNLKSSIDKEVDWIVVSDHGFRHASHQKGKEYPENHGKSLSWLPGSHDMNGMIFCSGPSFKSHGKIAGASILDITPTVLQLLGLPVAEDFDGRLLKSALNPEIISVEPVIIPAYETNDVEKTNLPVNAIYEKKVLEQLKAIGHLE